MKITIRRTERVMLTDAQIAEIMEYPETNFEHREMINRGHSAYLGNVVYEIEIAR